jgi:hypothetical protein
MLEFYFEVAKHVRICQVLCLDYLTCLLFYFEVMLNMLEFYFEVLLNMLELILMYVSIFSILNQPYLSNIWSSRKGRP